LLTAWFAHHQNTRDIIVKLHTGQGKTLMGVIPKCGQAAVR
jgi:superfamily II DNA or RNA helicase